MICILLKAVTDGPGGPAGTGIQTAPSLSQPASLNTRFTVSVSLLRFESGGEQGEEEGSLLTALHRPDDEME